MAERGELIDPGTMALVRRAREHRDGLADALGFEGREGSLARRGEVRDPRAATTVTGYQSPGQPMVPEWDAYNAVKWAYMANVIVYRCVQIKARTISSLTFRAGADPGRPRNYNVNAPLARLLGPPPGGPAPKLTGRRLIAWLIAQRTVTGRYACEIDTGNTQNGIAALWPLVSANLQAIPTTGGTEWFSSFKYGNLTKPVTLQPGQVFYGWNPSLTDFRQPESCLQAARLDISIAVMMDRYNYGFLRNDARPAAVIVTEAFENRDEFRRFKEQWNGEHMGPDNAGRMAFLEVEADSAAGAAGSLNVQVLGLSQKDARFIEQHKASLERVAIACGVPWSKLDASGRTFDNASQEDHNWWETDLLPEITDLQDEINMQLAPRLGSEVGWFDLTKVQALRPLRTFVAIGIDMLLLRRIARINEAREMADLDPIPDGDRFLTDEEVGVLQGRSPVAGTIAAVDAGVPAAALPAAAAAPVAPVVEDPGETRATHEHMHTHDDGTIHTHKHSHAHSNIDHTNLDPVPHTHAHGTSRTLQERVDAIVADLPQWATSRPAPDPAQRAEHRAAEWRAVDRKLQTVESRWRAAMARLFARQRAAVLRRLEGKRGRQLEHRADPTAASLFTADFWSEETRQLAEDLYEACVALGFARMTELFGISFDVTAPYALEFIAARANQLSGQVTDTTYAAIQDALAAGIEAGEGIPDLAARIGAVFDEASGARATLIARTETISAYNGSATLAANELGDDVVGGQEWIATADNRTRDDHAAADGEVVPIGESFDVGGELLAYPGDPNGSPENICNCRCTIGFLTPDEMAARGAAQPERRVGLAAAEAALAMLTPGGPLDELALRRALKAG